MAHSIEFSVSPKLKKWIQQQADQSGKSPSQFLGDVMQRERMLSDRAKIDRALLASLESGEGEEATEKYWDDFRLKAKKRAREIRLK